MSQPTNLGNARSLVAPKPALNALSSIGLIYNTAGKTSLSTEEMVALQARFNYHSVMSHFMSKINMDFSPTISAFILKGMFYDNNSSNVDNSAITSSITFPQNFNFTKTSAKWDSPVEFKGGLNADDIQKASVGEISLAQERQLGEIIRFKQACENKFLGKIADAVIAKGSNALPIIDLPRFDKTNAMNNTAEIYNTLSKAYFDFKKKSVLGDTNMLDNADCFIGITEELATDIKTYLGIKAVDVSLDNKYFESGVETFTTMNGIKFVVSRQFSKLGKTDEEYKNPLLVSIAGNTFASGASLTTGTTLKVQGIIACGFTAFQKIEIRKVWKGQAHPSKDDIGYRTELAQIADFGFERFITPAKIAAMTGGDDDYVNSSLPLAQLIVQQ